MCGRPPGGRRAVPPPPSSASAPRCRSLGAGAGAGRGAGRTPPAATPRAPCSAAPSPPRSACCAPTRSRTPRPAAGNNKYQWIAWIEDIIFLKTKKDKPFVEVSSFLVITARSFIHLSDIYTINFAQICF